MSRQLLLAVIAAGAAAALGCSAHLPPTLHVQEVVVIQVASNTETAPRSSFEVAIRVTNNTRVPARFGGQQARPWLEAVDIDAPRLSRGVVTGTGEALEPFVVQPGESIVVTKSLDLGQTPQGRYLLRFEPALQDPKRSPTLIIPAIIRVQ